MNKWNVLFGLQGLNLQELCVRAALAGFCFHGYQKVRTEETVTSSLAQERFVLDDSLTCKQKDHSVFFLEIGSSPT
jgi:hypothetical protein